MAYTDIVNVDISLNATALTQKGFGTIGFLAETRNFEERVRAYSSIEQMVEDGFVAPDTANGIEGDSAYRAALSIFGESPRPTYFKVLRRQTTSMFAPTTVGISGDYELVISFSLAEVDNTKYSAIYNAAIGENAQAICEGLKAAAELITDLNDKLNFTVTGIDDTALLEVTPIDSDTFFITYPEQSPLEITEAHASNEAGSVTCAKASAEDDDFYFVGAEDVSDAYVLDLSDYIQTVDKLYFVGSSDPLAITTPELSLPGQIRASNAKNTVVLFHQDSTELGNGYPEMSFAANNAVYDAGSLTWCNIQPNVAASTNPSLLRRLSISEKTQLNSIDCNYADYDSGVTFIRTGRTASGNFIDEIRGIHWLDFAITTELKSLLLNQAGSKVPYNNTGRMMVENAMAKALQSAVNRQFIDEFTITIPELDAIPANDKINRILNGVTFTGRLTGAIHEINVIGTVSPL